ncbi:MAG: hypothetical protein ACJAVK_003141 [Akkermansiaceae bacterium]|jgi:hypothetical protein
MTHVLTFRFEGEIGFFKGFPEICVGFQLIGLAKPQDRIDIKALRKLRRRVRKAEKEGRSSLECEFDWRVQMAIEFTQDAMGIDHKASGR